MTPGPDPAPLLLDFADSGRRDLASARDWLRGFSEEAAARFAVALAACLAETSARLGEKIAAGRPLPAPDEAASLTFSRPVYQTVFVTNRKRARRSSAGVWRVFFDLLDTSSSGGSGGRADTLRVLAVRHGAAQSLWIEESSEEGGDDAKE